MSDWRQIQARIRKARTSADPPGQLSALYERTHDAMVAFELAQLHEKAGTIPEAVRWFTTAAERFRRPQWKQKAEEGLVRLGAPIPVAPAIPAGVAVSETTSETVTQLEPIISEFSDDDSNDAEQELTEGTQETVFEQPVVEGAAAPATAQPSEAGPDRRRRRRGRRGGRGRHKGVRTAAPSAASASSAAVPSAPPAPPSMFDRVAAESRPFPVARPSVSADIAESRVREPEPARSYESAHAGPILSARVKSGDPALSSRLAQLESQLRRLLACSLHSLEQADDAPAGPGVFLITDTDLTTYYYAEACQTLRVGIGNMLRSGRGTREGSNLKEKLAEHLGINEARVGKYLKEHCGVRWLQLDEGAPLLAHFAVAVLRPISND
ncbi:MAG TPA: hypothetical protein VHS29_10760 [Candidatus Acidoferrales bacterium]|nr:hypothetical protein [Candidatus Acidoferrales bacterium]